jgi:hypothetical protein
MGAFSTYHVRGHIWELSHQIGARNEGSAGERAAASYIERQFRLSGYSPFRQAFALPGGRSSQNVIAELPGSSGSHRGDVLLIGAHYDAKGASCPGADDNASGVGILLEIARVLRGQSLPFTVRFVAFGSEEAIDSNKDRHHYGSRYHARTYRKSGGAAAGILGMISVDMVGVGSRLYVRSLGLGDPFMVQKALRSARALGMKASAKLDPGWSDHEPFERIGVPSVWLERGPSPAHHSRNDTYAHIREPYLAGVGRLVLHMILTLESARLHRAMEAREFVHLPTGEHRVTDTVLPRRDTGGFTSACRTCPA